MNIGAKIVEIENLPQNIEKLSAQREIYTLAKEILFWQVVFTVPIIIVLSLLKLFLEVKYNIKIEWLVSIFALILFVIDSVFINNLIKLRKEKAAAIQELFDCEVLDIKWNKMLFTQKPENSDIIKFHKLRQERQISYTKRKEWLIPFCNFIGGLLFIKSKLIRFVNKYYSQDNFTNWYSEPIKEIPHNVAKIICQRENINYDIDVRKNFIKRVVIISLLILILLVFLAAISDLTFRTFVISGITPFLPIFGITIKWYFEQNNSIKTLQEIKSVIETTWDRIIESNEIPNDTIIRQIQDRIHLHRKESALVPDLIYDMIRQKQEQQMDFSVNASVVEYQKAQTR